VDDTIDIGERKLTFTLHDPAYGGEKFSPAIMGNGTHHKYLLYFDSQFPYIHQNLVKIRLGTSQNVSQGIDVFDTMTKSQGGFVFSDVLYPSGNIERSAENIHSATFVEGSLKGGLETIQRNFIDDYTGVEVYKNGLSKMGYSFIIGLISVIASYLLSVPLGIMMARRKDGLLDKLGTIYIIFVIAVPSLAYIFLFRSIGGNLGLPTVFSTESFKWTMYILPIISLALPSIAGLMKWLRRYMIDQMNSDYVKFARSGGLSEGEIFRKHILKNAIIPIVHGIPGSVLGALVGAIITERVYTVPGTGQLLTEAINAIDNSVIVGVTLFYAVLSVASIILGDILISLVDPRISFTSKKR
jgi:oligopeptide transport system permease protein